LFDFGMIWEIPNEDDVRPVVLGSRRSIIYQ